MRRDARGMTLVETLVALALLGIGILMAGSVVVWADKVERRSSRRAAAVELATNVAEQLRAAPYELIRTGRLDLGSDLPTAGLEDATVDLEVGEEEILGVKRVRVTVSWTGDDAGRFALLTAVGRGEIYR